MNASDPEAPFRQTGWPGLRARLFHLYFLIRRPLTLGVRAVIHDREANAILLIRHTYVPGWQLPGGGVEVGETRAARAGTRACRGMRDCADRAGRAAGPCISTGVEPARPCR